MALSTLNKKISNRTAKIGIVGLGYVGLPLAIMFSKKFKVIGFDISKEKIDMLKNSKSYIIDVKDTDILKTKNFYPSTDEKDLLDCDFKIICVPTPLDKNGIPDMSFVKKAAKIISDNMKKGQFVITESTVYPGATRDDVIPILSKHGLVGEDFGVAFSPERIDPCNKKYRVDNTPKVVGGINDECTEIAARLYESSINANIIRVSSCEIAEATKILENTFREVNIGLINELALLFEKMNINIWDVVKAASSKPFGFMPFYPGFVGGHCTPVDPFYLSYKAKEYGFTTRFIELSGEINEFMKLHAIELAEMALKNVGKKIGGSTIAVFGLSYKKNINDTREAGAIKILEKLKKEGALIKVYDPFVSKIRINNEDFVSEKTAKDALRDADCAMFLVDHDDFLKVNIEGMRNNIVIDCKNLFDKSKLNGVMYYGIGKPIGD